MRRSPILSRHRLDPWIIALAMAAPALPANAHAQVLRVAELNTEQIRALDRARTVVILPSTILEQHGPYLPAYADGYSVERQTEELARAVAARAGWTALVFPAIPLGAGGANVIGARWTFPGSFTIRSETLRAVFMDLASELGELGFRWILIVNAHGAPHHNRALDQAGDFFRDRYDGRMVNLFGIMSVYDVIPRATTIPAVPADGFSVHAGVNETSGMMFLRPDLVSPARATAPDVRAENFSDLMRLAARADWPGYFGAPRLATAARGEALWREFAGEMIRVAIRVLDGTDPRTMPRFSDVVAADSASTTVERNSLAHDAARAREHREWLRTKGIP